MELSSPVLYTNGAQVLASENDVLIIFGVYVDEERASIVTVGMSRGQAERIYQILGEALGLEESTDQDEP